MKKIILNKTIINIISFSLVFAGILFILFSGLGFGNRERIQHLVVRDSVSLEAITTILESEQIPFSSSNSSFPYFHYNHWRSRPLNQIPLNNNSQYQFQNEFITGLKELYSYNNEYQALYIQWEKHPLFLYFIINGWAYDTSINPKLPHLLSIMLSIALFIISYKYFSWTFREFIWIPFIVLYFVIPSWQTFVIPMTFILINIFREELYSNRTQLIMLTAALSIGAGLIFKSTVISIFIISSAGLLYSPGQKKGKTKKEKINKQRDHIPFEPILLLSDQSTRTATSKKIFSRKHIILLVTINLFLYILILMYQNSYEQFEPTIVSNHDGIDLNKYDSYLDRQLALSMTPFRELSSSNSSQELPVLRLDERNILEDRELSPLESDDLALAKAVLPLQFLQNGQSYKWEGVTMDFPPIILMTILWILIIAVMLQSRNKTGVIQPRSKRIIRRLKVA